MKKLLILSLIILSSCSNKNEFNLTASSDIDSDEICDSLDPDDDGDQLGDDLESQLGTDPNSFDTDGDGYSDSIDDLPLDETEWEDSDGDGVGDNKDAAPSIARYQSTGDIAIDSALAVGGTFLVAFGASWTQSRVSSGTREDEFKAPASEDED